MKQKLHMKIALRKPNLHSKVHFSKMQNLLLKCRLHSKLQFEKCKVHFWGCLLYNMKNACLQQKRTQKCTFCIFENCTFECKLRFCSARCTFHVLIMVQKKNIFCIKKVWAEDVSEGIPYDSTLFPSEQSRESCFQKLCRNTKNKWFDMPHAVQRKTQTHWGQSWADLFPAHVLL